MGDFMKRLITLVSLVGLATLNAACAEETGTAKQATSAATENATRCHEYRRGGHCNCGQEYWHGCAGNRHHAISGGPDGDAHRDAKPAGQLPANTAVDILERQGGWMRISAKGKTGWAKLHQVRMGEGPESEKFQRSGSAGKMLAKPGVPVRRA